MICFATHSLKAKSFQMYTHGWLWGMRFVGSPSAANMFPICVPNCGTYVLYYVYMYHLHPPQYTFRKQQIENIFQLYTNITHFLGMDFYRCVCPWWNLCAWHIPPHPREIARCCALLRVGSSVTHLLCAPNWLRLSSLLPVNIANSKYVHSMSRCRCNWSNIMF